MIEDFDPDDRREALASARMADGAIITRQDPHERPSDDDPNTYIQWIYWPGYTQDNRIAVDIRGGWLLPINNGYPVRLPPELGTVKQPFVGTCARPGRGEAGCAAWKKCSFRRYAHLMRAAGKAPWKAIMTVPGDGTEEAMWCYQLYEMTDHKDRQILPGAVDIGWRFLTSKTTVRVKNAAGPE